MDWITGIGRAVAYIEENLAGEIDPAEAAARSFSSPSHFARVFSILSGYTLGEYVRLRRLTLAGAELARGETKVIDAALKYGYDSPDSFARAFQLVCKRLGIPSGYVFGNTKKTAKVTHAWNIVWIGESIYHIDLTSAVSQYSSNHVLGYPCFLQTAEEILRWRFVMEPFPRAENLAGNYLTSLGYRFDSQADLEKILRSFSRDQNRRSISLQSGPAFTAVDEVQRVLRQALKGFAIGCSYSTFSTGVCVVTKSPRRKKYEARVVKYNG